MGREEQIEEREVLDSIFPDEITGTVPSPLCAYITKDQSKDADCIPQTYPQMSTGYQ